MGNFLTGISAEDPKQKTSSSFHVIHSEFKTILQPLFNDPHPGYTREARAMGKEVGRENFFFFLREALEGCVFPIPTPAIPPRLWEETIKGSTAGDRLLVRMDNWPHTPGRRLAEPQKSKGQKLPRDQSRPSRENIGNPGTGT